MYFNVTKSLGNPRLFNGTFLLMLYSKRNKYKCCLWCSNRFLRRPIKKPWAQLYAKYIKSCLRKCPVVSTFKKFSEQFFTPAHTHGLLRKITRNKKINGFNYVYTYYKLVSIIYCTKRLQIWEKNVKKIGLIFFGAVNIRLVKWIGCVPHKFLISSLGWRGHFERCLWTRCFFFLAYSQAITRWQKYLLFPCKYYFFIV